MFRIVCMITFDFRMVSYAILCLKFFRGGNAEEFAMGISMCNEVSSASALVGFWLDFEHAETGVSYEGASYRLVPSPIRR
jgi:hypothetical protein